MKYRKKPVVIEAQQLCIPSGTGGNAHIAIWCNGQLNDDQSIVIPTLEGDMLAQPVDYVIKGVAG